VTTVGSVCLAEKLVCSTADGSGVYLDVHGNFPVVFLFFQKME
jgi:hypothetical protein